MNPSKAITANSWWRKFKKKVRARDSNKCRIKGCGEKGDIVAHIMPRRNYPELVTDFSNVVLLCAWHDREYGERLEEPSIKKLYDN